jgi:hypothetical protein
MADALKPLYKDLHSALKEEDYNAGLSAANKGAHTSVAVESPIPALDYHDMGMTASLVIFTQINMWNCAVVIVFKHHPVIRECVT